MHVFEELSNFTLATLAEVKVAKQKPKQLFNNRRLSRQSEGGRGGKKQAPMSANLFRTSTMEGNPAPL